MLLTCAQDIADVLSNVLEETNEEGWMQLQTVSKAHS